MPKPCAPRIGRLDDRILRVEPGEPNIEHTNASDRQCPGHHRCKGQRDLLPQAAVIAHVLLVMHRMDDRARAQEQQRLEEGMREQVEHRGAIGANARRKEHIAQLATGRISDNPLDIPLGRTNRCSKEARRCAHNRDHVQRYFTLLEQRRQTANHEHARRHHGGRMDQRRHRRRAFHRVRQPCMQPQLRRLAHRADEQQQAQHR